MNRHHAIRSQWGPIAFLRLRDRTDCTVGGISSVVAAVLITCAVLKWSFPYIFAACPFVLVAALFWTDHFAQIAELRADIARIIREDEEKSSREER